MSDSPRLPQQLYIETVGCQMNMLDSELVVAALRKEGYTLTADVASADAVLFNTCSVREHAEHKIYSALGRIKHNKQRRPDQVIGVIGCMAQKDQELIFRRAPHVDLVVGTGQLAQIPELIRESRLRREQRLAVSLDRRDATRREVSDSFQSYDPLRDPEMRPSPFQAFVRIMIGCDKFCTYCVVPMTRGPEQSRPPADILREVRQLANEGVREVTLLGQTVNSYKFTQDGRTFKLADLILQMHEISGLDRIRFVTNYPRDMDDDLLQAMRDLPKVCRYLHVPAQSGCNEILKRMKRGYTVEQYREMWHRIRETLPDCSISSDFIVGFSGESETAFEKSMNLIRELRFKNSFIFKYSPRPGTKAIDLLPDDVPEETKRRRNNEMLALQNSISEEQHVEFIGRDVEILVEGPSKNARKARGAAEPAATHDEAAPALHHIHTDDAPLPVENPGHRHHLHRADRSPADDPPDDSASPGKLQLTGRTSCDRIVVFDGNPRLAGSLVRVHIEDCTATTLVGSIITREYQHGPVNPLPILV